MSENSPLEDGPLTPDMAGLIGSLLSFGALTGCLILSLISNYIGLKKSILLCGIPITVRSTRDTIPQNCLLRSSVKIIA